MTGAARIQDHGGDDVPGQRACPVADAGAAR